MAFSPFQLHRHFPSSASDGEEGEAKSVPTPTSASSAQRVVGFAAAHGDPWSPNSVLAAQEPGAKGSSAGHNSRQSTLASAIHKEQQVQLQPPPGRLSIKTKVAGAAGGPALKGLQLRRAQSTGQPLVGREGRASAHDGQAGGAGAAAGERRGTELQLGAKGGLQRAGGRQQAEMTRQRSASIDIPRHVFASARCPLPWLEVAELLVCIHFSLPEGFSIPLCCC